MSSYTLYTTLQPNIEVSAPTPTTHIHSKLITGAHRKNKQSNVLEAIHISIHLKSESSTKTRKLTKF